MNTEHDAERLPTILMCNINVQGKAGVDQCLGGVSMQQQHNHTMHAAKDELHNQQHAHISCHMQRETADITAVKQLAAVLAMA